MTSRQYQWQKRQVASGKCRLCGRRRSRLNKNLCERHRILGAAYQARWRAAKERVA